MLVEAQQTSNHCETPRTAENVAVENVPHAADEPGPLVMLFDLSAGALHDACVLHAGGAGGLARAAVKAAVDVGDKRIANRESACIDLQHLVDASARRIHLHPQYPIRRAMIQAEATMNTGGVKVPTWAVAACEVRVAHLQRVLVRLLLACIG